MTVMTICGGGVPDMAEFLSALAGQRPDTTAVAVDVLLIVAFGSIWLALDDTDIHDITDEFDDPDNWGEQ